MVGGDRLLRSAWSDPSRLTPEVLAGYRAPMQVADWDRALWELSVAREERDWPENWKGIQVPALIVTGEDDRIVPVEDSARLAAEMPRASLVVLADCGHVAHEECPGPFLQATTQFLASLAP